MRTFAKNFYQVKQIQNTLTMNKMEHGKWKMENPARLDADNGEPCVFVPKEVIDSFHHVFNCVKEARYELIKVAEAMKPI